MPPTNTLRAFFLSLACFTLLGCGNNPVSVEVEQLLKTSETWDGTPYAPYSHGQPEITVVKITVPANTSLNWHEHPMPNVAYVLSGELLVEIRDSDKKITVSKGQVLPEVVNTAHRGTSGNKPVELIVFYAGGTGMPLSK